MNKPLISILISTYNWPCFKLAGQLEELVNNETEDIEIIVGEDASTDPQILHENQKIKTLPHCKYVYFTENNGRAKIRNKLSDIAQGKYLLFIDGDALVMSTNFLNEYINNISNHDVIYGGISTPVHISDKKNRTLRLAYEKAAENIRSLSFRKKNPYKYISAFNILIKHELFDQIKFNENCTLYGYEDALLGVELKIRKKEIYHIDNPLLHTGIDSNEEYLEKIKDSLATLYSIGNTMQNESSICKIQKMITKVKLNTPIDILFTHFFKKRFEKNLLSTSPSLTILKLYKIGYYCHICQENENRRKSI